MNESDGATDEEKKAAREAAAAEWRLVESQLSRILLDAVPSLQLSDNELAKYCVSATEQEIMCGVMHVPEGAPHVYCFFRNLHSANGRPLREDLSCDDAVKNFLDLNDDESLDNDASDKLQYLKSRLRERLGKNVHEYKAQWIGASQSPVTLDHIGSLPLDLDDCLKLVENEEEPALLCVDVWRRLARVILDEVAQIERVSPVQREKEEHERFGDKRSKYFCGRARYLTAIQQYIDAQDQHPFVLWGESGSGKSALLARAAEQINKANPNAEIVIRFIGATPQSLDVRALLESLCLEISGLYEVEQETIPADYNGLLKEFPKRLALATEQKPLVLVLDALDQLSNAEYGLNLTWLPTKLPENVRLIASTIDGECLTALQRKLPPESILYLEVMAKSEGAEVLDLWLKGADRTLQEEQRAEVLNKFAVHGLPLYLKLAFEEARLWHSYDGVNPLAADVPGIVSNLFGRLSDKANHGALLISRGLGYLAAARNGLTEDEILEVLSSDEQVMDEFRSRSVKSPVVDALPIVVWSRLYFDLEPYLTERYADGTNLIAFYHSQLREVVTQEFLAGDEKRERNIALASFFSGQPYFLETLDVQRERALRLPPTPRTANLRKASELAWQLRGAGQWEELDKVLTNLTYLEAKAEAGMVFDLARDFDGIAQ
ncbi:MAG TPA: ATP-binding protein, partial [Anaerolineales bacterium]|nr:ATP-binding protein [Anaerolineales bacterium]